MNRKGRLLYALLLALVLSTTKASADNYTVTYTYDDSGNRIAATRTQIEPQRTESNSESSSQPEDTAKNKEEQS